MKKGRKEGGWKGGGNKRRERGKRYEERMAMGKEEGNLRNRRMNTRGEEMGREESRGREGDTSMYL